MLGSIHVGGDEFEREQQLLDVRASSSSSWPEEDAPRRSYRLAEDYKGRRAEDYLAAVNRDRQDMEIWNGIPERLRTQRMQTAITQLLCSGAGHVNEVLFGQRGFPNRMLYSVMERGLISAIDEEKRCARRLDSFTEHFVSEYPDISTAEAKACLLYTSPSPRDGLLSRMPSSA